MTSVALRIGKLASRLSRTSGDEFRFRLREQGNVAIEAVRFAVGGERWTRRSLRSGLVPLSPQLEQGRDALDRGDWRRAGAAIRSHFVGRAQRFPISAAGRSTLSDAIARRFPQSAGDATARAERIANGHYDLLGYQNLSFRNGQIVDWHLDPVHARRPPAAFWTRVPYLDPRVGDHKIIWEINRHQHWLALGRAAWLTGNTRYAAALRTEFETWLAANPPLTGINWSSMLEVGFRSLSWIWTLHFFAPFGEDDDQVWLLDLLVALDRQLDHIARHLSRFFSPNTHLLGEGLALYVAGRVLPELSSATRWEQIGREILARESRAQIHPDGGHAELSMHYHRYALDFYLLALVIARRTNDGIASHFAETVSRLANFCRAMADGNGWLPTIGDDDGGLLFPICGRAPADVRDSLALAAVLLDRPELSVGEAPEEVFWMLGEEPPPLRARPAPRGVQAFPHTGYVAIRSDDGHMILDAGHHGFMNGGHAHADALSLVLSVRGRPLLIDPGTATYTVDQRLRDWFRSTAMHNTIVVNRTMQAVPAGPFHWQSAPCAHADLKGSGPGFDYVEAQHDGYQPLEHRRGVLRLRNGLWLVVDHLIGTGPHRVDAYWHVHPAWTIEPSAGPSAPECSPGAGELARFKHDDGLWAAVASTSANHERFRGDAEGFGWCAPIYGQRIPSPTLRVTQTAAAPFSLITAIAAGNSPVRLSIECATVIVDREDGWHRAAVSVTHGDADVVVMFAAPCQGARETRFPQRLRLSDGDLITDGRVALVRRESGGVRSVDVIAGSQAFQRVQEVQELHGSSGVA